MRTLQPIIYRGELVACVTATRCILSGKLDRRPAGDPETTFVLCMCAYVGDVLRGELPGPYADQRAREFVRAALIPEELLERPCPGPTTNVDCARDPALGAHRRRAGP